MLTVSVPRRAFRSATTVELHVFTDASNSAFAALIYARQPTFSHTSAQQISVIGKSRVSPIKQKGIPKLELEAAVLGVCLLRIVRNTFSCSFPVVKFWTDSCVVLDWIQRQNKLKSFDAHRVNEITLHSHPLDWKYVPTKQTLQITVPVVSDPTKFPPNGSKVHRFSTNRPKIGPNDRKQPLQPSLLIKSQSFSTLNVSPPGATY